MKTLIKNGIICLEGGIFEGDLVVDGEIISEITTEYKGDCDEVIDAKGKYVCPGGVDAHTHMSLRQSSRYTSCDSFYDGGVAAACGGTTTILDHMSFGEKGCSLYSRFEEYKELAKDCPIDYSFHGVFQKGDEEVNKELADIIENKGFTSYKAYTTYGYPICDKDMLNILYTMKETGGLLCVHSENDAITNVLREKYAKLGHTEPIYQAITRPNEAEAESVARAVHLAKTAGDSNLYIVHMSAKESLYEVKLAREKGQKNIFVETCTQYLMLTDDKFVEGGSKEGIKYILAPPLRKKEDNEVLWKGVADGDIQVIATDHCPFTLEQKQEHADDYRNCPGGISGVEERMPIIFSEGVMKGRITLEKFVEVTATNPAKIFGLYPKKGTLLPGSDADITIIDPTKSRVFSVDNLKTKAGFSPFEGLKVDCVIDTVLSRGKVVAKNNEFVGEKGRGKLLLRKPIKF